MNAPKGLTKNIGVLDVRSLGVLRVVLGVILLVKFCVQVPVNFHHVYSPAEGVLGNCFAEGYVKATSTSAPLFHIQTDGPMWAFVVVTGIVMLLFTVGLYPQLMALVGSVLLWGFHDRYQMLWFGWEQYAQVLLFMAIFLPVGRAFTRFRTRESPAYTFCGPLAVAFLFQIGFIYFFNGISKNGDKWWDGTAIQFALGQLDKRTALGEWLVHQDFLAQAFNWGTLLFEFAVLPLLFIPWKNARIRLGLAIAIPLFHWALALFMDVGFFKYVSLAAGVALIPSFVWEKVRLPRLPKPRRLPSPTLRLPAWVPTATAALLIWCIVTANLHQSFHSKTPDRMKQWFGGTIVEEFINTLTPEFLPPYTFFRQHWHFFSPDPPTECGYIQAEVVFLDGRSQAVYSGIARENSSPTALVKFMNAYLTISRANKKSELLASCYASREANLWYAKNPENRIQAMRLMLYSWQPKTVAELQAGPEGQVKPFELIRLGITYDNP